jgi:hypothetical protein
VTDGPHDKVTHGGQTLTRRVWALIADASQAIGLDEPVEVGQGGFKGGGGASASAGTHDEGDVYDLRISQIPERLWVPLAVELRKRNACAWVRSPEYGWTSTGPHLHAVQRDSHYPLSRGARQQIENYDDGLNGLANGARDPHPRPEQHPFVMGAPPAPIQMEDDEMIILKKGASQFRLLSGGRMAGISEAAAENLHRAGVKIVGIPNDDWPALERAFGG